MKKRGQVTIFIIIGIIMLITAGLVVFIKSIPSKHGGTEITRHTQLEPQKLRSYMQTCLDDEAVDLIRNASINGGYINITKFSGDYTVYKGEKYYYHCLYTEGNGCQNKFITREKIQEDINSYIKEAMKNCIDFSIFEEEFGYKITTGDINIRTEIGTREVLVDVEYPVVMKKDDYEITVDGAKGLYYSDIGYLYDIYVQILNQEIENNFFDQDDFMNDHGSVMIEKHRPYPDTLYLLRRYDERSNSYLSFKFGIQGHDNAYQIGWPEMVIEDRLGSWCKTEDDNCYINLLNAECPAGSIYSEKPRGCEGPSKVMITEEHECSFGACSDCSSDIKHGDSWCVYEGVSGSGLDLVGSRHYKKSCFDGIIYTEECRDFRQEICVKDSSINKALCRVNRWEDCATINSKDDCLNRDERDCEWNENFLGTPESTGKRNRRDYLCHPAVPPGFEHWVLPFSPLCELAGEAAECDFFECPQKWNDRTSWYCLVQSDCGYSRNIADKYFEGGFYTTNDEMNNGKPSPSGYLPEGSNKNRYYDIGLSLVHSSGEYITEKIDVSDIKYENTEGNRMAAIDNKNQFMNKASSWDECTFCPCPLGFPIPPCEYDELTAFSAFCETFAAPKGGNDCTLCTSKFESCTEYKCKSLGKTCNFYYNETGYPVCENPLGKPRKYTIDWNHETPSGFKITDESAGFSSPKIYLICNNESTCINGVNKHNEIGLQPFTPINFTVIIDGSEAACKTSFIPMFSYDEVYTLLSDFNTKILTEEFEYNAYVSPPDTIKEFLNNFKQFANVIYGMNIELLNQKIQETASAIESSGGDASAFIENWNNELPRLERFYSEFPEEMQEFFESMGNRRATIHFKCSDKHGNEPENDLQLFYYIADDKTPPILEKVSPQLGKTMPNPFNISVKFNEPVECRYDFEDKDYKSMEYALGCPQYYFLFFSGSGVTCPGEIEVPPDKKGNTTIYLTCIDQPGREEKFMFHFKKQGSNLRASENYPDLFSIEGSKLSISNSTKLINETYGSSYSFVHNSDDIEIKFWNDNPNIECSGYESNNLLSVYGAPYFAAGNIDIGCVEENGRAKCSTILGTTDNNDRYLKISCQEQRRIPRNTGKYILYYNFI